MSEALGRWHVTYTPGTWLVLAGPTTAVVLEPADASWSDLVETLWLEVLAAGSIGDLAARLATYRIDRMPSFAAFFWGPDGMRSLVRGDVRVVDLDTDGVVADGDGVQTWTEVGLPGTTRVRVDLPTDHDPSAYPMPLVIGVVGASSVLLDAGEEAQLGSPQSDLGWAEDEGDVPDENAYDEGGAHADVPQEDVPQEDVPQEDGGRDDGGQATQLVDPFADDEPYVDAVAPLADPATGQGWPETAPSGPTVAAVFCGWGHPNPPGAARCRVCEALVGAQQPRAVAPPVLAVLRASNGDSVELDRPVLVGRAPSRDRSRVEDPELLTVSSPSHDISRTHLEVVPEQWDVTVTDLHSTNGTVLIAPDGAARQLQPGESVVVQLGTAIELADGVSVLVDFPQ